MIAFVIPALNPTKTLIELVESLSKASDGYILVINDGSASREVFDQLPVEVFHHDINRGKGEALRSAFRWLNENQTVPTIVTLDADGQHRVEDVVAVADRAIQSPSSLVLGVRQFSGDVPLRSQIGNRLTAGILKGWYGLQLQDSQTGLRAIPIEFATQCLDTIQSPRYGFELEMLLLARQLEVEILQEPIATVYLDGNAESHFRPIMDSLSVYFVFLRFSAVSLSSFVIDIGLFALSFWVTDSVFVATYFSRFFSGTFNFLSNRQLVFKARSSSIWVHLLGYVCLAFCIASLSAIAVSTLSDAQSLTPTLVKLGVDPLLFLLSFIIQKYFIFKRI